MKGGRDIVPFHKNAFLLCLNHAFTESMIFILLPVHGGENPAT